MKTNINLDFSNEMLSVLKDSFNHMLSEEFFCDYAMLGAASDNYSWRPSPNAEVDVCIFIKDFSMLSGQKMIMLRERLIETMLNYNIQSEFRVIRGPYKSTPSEFSGTFLTVHGAIFTDQDYEINAARLLRWSWRKYKCMAMTNRLKIMSGTKPDLNELLTGKLGVCERIAKLETKNIFMQELVFPDFSWDKFAIENGSNMFYEYAIACAANTSRNHGRVLEFEEADYLDNDDYFEFYSENVFKSTNFDNVIGLKKHVRLNGYSDIDNRSYDHSLGYLCELRDHLQNGG